jgi:hypothetical protein
VTTNPEYPEGVLTQAQEGYDWADDSKKCYDLWIAYNRTKFEARCPFCGTPNYQVHQEHGHYVTRCCRQTEQGCCSGECAP